MKLTKEKAAEFLGFIRTGVTLKDAAAMIGVNSSTIYNWTKLGKREADKAEKNGGHIPAEVAVVVNFSGAYARARAEYSNALLSAATTCALAGEGKMLQFLMKADKPDVYGDRQHITADVSTNVVTLYSTTVDASTTTLVLPEGDE